MGDMEAVGPRDLHQQDTANAHHVGPFDDDQSGWDVPKLVFPRPWEDCHEENPMQPLFQAGTLGSNDDTSPSSFFVDSRDEPLCIDRSNIDTKNVFKHPAALPIKQVNRPNHQVVYPTNHWPITNCLPAQIQEMEANYQHDK